MIPKIIFIIPYRNRELDKIRFSVYMNYLLEDYNNNNYEIYFSHQCDNRPFNRGATKNIGFLVAKEKYPDNYKNITFVFNDIDNLPIVKNNINYETKINEINHIYGFKFALGGIFSIKGIDFEKCDGFPNNWGWGLEDNTINNRALNKGLIINRNNLNSIGSKNIMHFTDSKMRLVNDKDTHNFFKKNINDNLSNITELTYEIIKNNENTKIELINQYIININSFETLKKYDLKDLFMRDVSINNKIQGRQKNNNLKNMNKFFKF